MRDNVPQHFDRIMRATQKVDMLFIQKCLGMLKPTGRLGIVVPESLLILNKFQNIRQYLLNHCIVRAVISLSAKTFVPYSGTKANIMILQKRPFNNKIGDYPILFAEAPDNNQETFREITEVYHAFLREASKN